MVVIGFWLIGGLVGYAAAQSRGYSTVAGVLAGFLLGPLLAWLLFLVSGVTRNDRRRTCPLCAEWVQARATFCKHCRQPIPPPLPTAALADRRSSRRGLTDEQ